MSTPNPFYDDMAAVAVELLGDDEFGMTVNLTRTTPGTLSPITGTVTGGSTTTIPIHVAEIQINNAYAALLGGSIQITDKLIMVDPQTALQMTDKIALDGSLYGIIKIVPYNPAGTPVAYMAQLRK